MYRCIKRGSPDKCKVDDEQDRPSYVISICVSLNQLTLSLRRARQPFAQARELAAVKDRVHRLEQLLLAIAPEQAKAMLQGDLQHDQSFAQAAPLNMAALKGSESDMEDDEDEDGEDGGEAEKAAFALESIAVAGRPPTVRFRLS